MMTTRTQFRSPTTTPMLPPESWNHIFQYLSSDDLHSVRNTCPEWSQLLEENQNAFLLPLTLPALMKYLDVNTTLKLRQISFNAKQIVDKTLQETLYDADEKDCKMRYYEYSSGKKNLRLVAHKLSSCYSFILNSFGDYSDKVFPDFSLMSPDINPFLMRHVEYSIGLQTNFRPVPTAHVTSILPKFGHNLTSLTCVIGADTSNQLFHHIVNPFRHVPNLKRLQTTWVGVGHYQWRQAVLSILTQLSDTVIDFPTLPKLTDLDIRDDVTDGAPVLTFVLAIVRHYSQQLTSFTCDASLLALRDLNVDVLNTMFPNIKKFQLLGKKPDLETGLEKLSNVSWFLERLTLKLHLRYQSEMNVRKVLSTINNFHQSLIHLEIHLILVEEPEIGKGKESGEEYKNMSKLNILINNSKSMKSPVFRQFLQNNCQSLKQLHFETNNIMCREEGKWALEQIGNLEKVVFWNYWHGLCDSSWPSKITVHQVGSNK